MKKFKMRFDHVVYDLSKTDNFYYQFQPQIENFMQLIPDNAFLDFALI